MGGLDFGMLNSFSTTSEGFGKIPVGQFDWSVHGSNFISRNAASLNLDAYYYTAGIEAAGGSFYGICSVNLPHGVTIISAIVKGADAADTWTLKRINTNTGAVETMASGTFNTIDTTITHQLVDNNQYAYFMETGAVADNIYAARITYDQ